MSQEIQHFTVTIPAGTLSSAPVTVNIATGVRIVRQIDWRVPNGPMGTFGWRITMGGVQVFPTAGDLWVVANDESGSWPVTAAPDSGAWQVAGYNTGTHPHAVYLAVHCDPVTRRPALTADHAAYELGLAPDLSLAGPPLAGR